MYEICSKSNKFYFFIELIYKLLRLITVEVFSCLVSTSGSSPGKLFLKSHVVPLANFLLFRLSSLIFVILTKISVLKMKKGLLGSSAGNTMDGEVRPCDFSRKNHGSSEIYAPEHNRDEFFFRHSGFFVFNFSRKHFNTPRYS